MKKGKIDLTLIGRFSFLYLSICFASLAWENLHFGIKHNFFHNNESFAISCQVRQTMDDLAKLAVLMLRLEINNASI